MKKFRRLALLALLSPATLLLAADVAPQSTELRGDHLEMRTVGTETRAVCTGSVTLTGTNLRILCDRLEIIADGVGDKTAAVPTLEKFKYLLATGHVRIVQGEREATCGRAEVLPREDKVILTQDPVVVDRSTGWVQAGETITLLRGERGVLVDKPRVNGPSIKDLGFDKNKAAPPDGALPTPGAQK